MVVEMHDEDSAVVTIFLLLVRTLSVSENNNNFLASNSLDVHFK